MGFFKSAEDYYKEMTSTLKDVNTSKPGFVYNSLNPSSYEFSYQSMMLDEIPKMMFAKKALDNGYYDCLIDICSDMGVDRKLSTYAIGTIKVTGKPTYKFPIGSLVSTQLGLTYITQSDVVLDTNGTGYVSITASAKGSKYNVDIGEINTIPVKYEGILSVTNEEKVTSGYDDETYEALYERYSLKVRTPATSGNKYHYMNWALEVDGVGSVQVYPLWDKNNGLNGNGTVKVVIANSNYRAASEDLIKAVYDHIEEERPIGPTITVVSVEELALNITALLEYDSSTYDLNTLKTNITNVLLDYLKSVASATKKVKEISIMKIGALILSGVGVDDCISVSINGSNVNIPITDNQIPVLGEVICNEA